MLDFRPHKIQVCYVSGGGYDENHRPVPVTEQWGEPVPCRFESDSKELMRFTDAGPVREFSYVVWMDYTDERFLGLKVRLIDQNDIVVAETEVKKQPPLQLRTKLFL